MKINVNAKSAPIYDEFLAKINCGFKNIEIQLIHPYLSEQEYEDTDRIIKENLAKINVVHSPLLKVPIVEHDEEITLNSLVDRKFYDMFVDTCKFAQHIAEIENQRIKIVIHNEYSKQLWIETNLIDNVIGPRIRDALKFFDNIDLVVENTSCIEEKRFNSFYDMEDVSFVVHELNKYINGRINPLMDTCHLMMGWEAWKRVSGGEDITDWQSAFKNATMYEKLGLIHLNNMWDNGIDEDHGRPFTIDNIEDMKKLKEIMSCYKKYADCDITIEVKEDNYKETPYNLLKTKEALETIHIKLKCN